MENFAPLLPPAQSPAETPVKTLSQQSGTKGSDTAFSTELDNAVSAAQAQEGEQNPTGNHANDTSSNQSAHSQQTAANPQQNVENHNGESGVNDQLNKPASESSFHPGAVGSQLQTPALFQLIQQPQVAQVADTQLHKPQFSSPQLEQTVNTLSGNPFTASPGLDQPGLQQGYTLHPTEGPTLFTEQNPLRFSYNGNYQQIASQGQPQQESLLNSQLQDLIGRNETGTITITRQNGAPVTLSDLNSLTQQGVPSQTQSATAATAVTQFANGANSTDNAGQLSATLSQLTNLKASDAGINNNAARDSIEPLRQEFQGQFFEARVDAKAKADGGPMGQQMAQQEMMPQNQTLSNQNSSIFSTNESSSSFSQILTANQPQAQPQQPVNSSPVPLTTPQAGAFTDENILNQVTDKFQINLRNQQTQLNIKLHPAELGELKIDLTMKDGSIKAHVVAQSGQVQEVLERNMAKLKHVLEEQGLSIEEIVVSQKSESDGDFNFFDDQLANGNQTERESFATPAGNFNETFEEIVSDTGDSQTGVNLTI